MTTKQWDLKTYNELLEMFPKQQGHFHWGFFWIMENKFRMRSCMRLEENKVIEFNSVKTTYPDYNFKLYKKRAKEYFK